MKKRFTVLTAIMLCVVMLVGFSACGGTADDDETDVFVAATVPVRDSLPVSKADIIAFYNDIITKVQQADTFTAENRPGLKTTESLRVGDLKILSYDPQTGEATEDDSLKALNKSAKAIKDRILGGIDTSKPLVAFGDLNTTPISSVIHPADSDTVYLDASDITKAECYVDGNNMNIYMELANTPQTIAKVFGIRDKNTVLAAMNEHSSEYATVNDYTVSYVDTEDENSSVHSTINLSVELEKQEDGSYKCTGRITTFKINVIADVSAYVTCGGSFADAGDIQVNFRLTDVKNYDFDWLGSADWEPYEAVTSAE